MNMSPIAITHFSWLTNVKKANLCQQSTRFVKMNLLCENETISQLQFAHGNHSICHTLLWYYY